VEIWPHKDVEAGAGVKVRDKRRLMDKAGAAIGRQLRRYPRAFMIRI
jgi:hypothetical protein